MKDFDKEFEEHWDDEETFMLKERTKSFFHFQLEKILSEVKNCVPTHCICCEIQHTGKCSCAREQMIKNLELLLKNKEK